MIASWECDGHTVMGSPNSYTLQSRITITLPTHRGSITFSRSTSRLPAKKHTIRYYSVENRTLVPLPGHEKRLLVPTSTTASVLAAHGEAKHIANSTTPGQVRTPETVLLKQATRAINSLGDGHAGQQSQHLFRGT